MSVSINPVSNANANNPLGGGLKRAYYAENGTAAPVKIPRSSNFPGAFPNDLPSMNINTGTPEMSAASKLSNATVQYVRIVSPVDTYALRNDNFDDLQPQSLVFVDYEEKLIPPKLAPTSQELCSISGLIWINRQLKELPFTAQDAVRINYAPQYTDDDGNRQVRHTMPWAQAIYDMKQEIAKNTPNQPDTPQFVEALEVLNRWRLDGVLLTSDLKEYRQHSTTSNMPLAFNVAVKGDVLVRNGNESPRIYLEQIPVNAPHGYSKNHQFDAKVRCGHSLYVGVHVEKHPTIADRYIYQMRLWSSRLFAKYESLTITRTTTEEDVKLTKSLICMVGAWRLGTVKDSRASINAKTSLDAAESIQCGVSINIQWMPIKRLRLRETTLPNAISYGYGLHAAQQLLGFVGYNASVLRNNDGTNACRLNADATSKLRYIQTTLVNLLNYMFQRKTPSGAPIGSSTNSNSTNDDNLIIAVVSSIMDGDVDVLLLEKLTNVMATEQIGATLNRFSVKAPKLLDKILSILETFVASVVSNTSQQTYTQNANALVFMINDIRTSVGVFQSRNKDNDEVCTSVPSTQATIQSFVSTNGIDFGLLPYFYDYGQKQQSKVEDLTKFLEDIYVQLTSFDKEFRNFYNDIQDDLPTFETSWKFALDDARKKLQNSTTVRLDNYATVPEDSNNATEFSNSYNAVTTLNEGFAQTYNLAVQQYNTLVALENQASTIDGTNLIAMQTFVNDLSLQLNTFRQAVEDCKRSYDALSNLIASDEKFNLPALLKFQAENQQKVNELTSFVTQSTVRLAMFNSQYVQAREASQTQSQPVNSGAFPAVNTVTQSSAAIAAKPASRSTGMVGVNVSTAAAGKMPVAATSKDSREQSPLRQSSAKPSRSSTSKSQTSSSSTSSTSSTTQRKTRGTPATPAPKPPPNPMADSDDEFF